MYESSEILMRDSRIDGIADNDRRYEHGGSGQQQRAERQCQCLEIPLHDGEEASYRRRHACVFCIKCVFHKPWCSSGIHITARIQEMFLVTVCGFRLR